MTIKLFYENARLLEFQAQIIKTKLVEDSPAICLDKTAFYPTSGGQPFDTGWINNIRVSKVWEENEEIWHQVDVFPTEDKIMGSVDFSRRFDHMQQHTGQHLLSAVFFDELNANTIGFHIGTKSNTIDLDIPNLTNDDMDKIERITNYKVWSNIPVKTLYPLRTEMQQFHFRKSPKVFEKTRVIQIGNFDVCACGGTHVDQTGEIGVIKISQTERYKGGVRVTFLCGQRALKDYQHLQIIIKKASLDLSIHSDDLPNAIGRLMDDANNNLHAYKQAQKELMIQEAGQMWKDAELINGLYRITAHFENRSFSDLKILAAILRDQPKTLILLASSIDGRVSLLCTRSQDLIDINSNLILKNALVHLGGKGGGTSEMAQGGAPMNASHQVSQILFDSIQSWG